MCRINAEKSCKFVYIYRNINRKWIENIVSIMEQNKTRSAEPTKTVFIQSGAQDEVEAILNDESYKTTLEDGRKSKFYFQRVLNTDYSIMLLCLVNIMLSVLYCDADYSNKTKIATWSLYLINATTMIEVVVTILRYKLQIKLQINQKILKLNEGLLSSGKIYEVAIEILLLLIQPYFWLNNHFIQSTDVFSHFSFPFKLNYVLVILGFLKAFVVLRVLLRRQIYMSPRSSRLCRVYGCKSDYLYAVKCLFMDSPIQFVLIVFAGSILIFSCCFRIAERPLATAYPLYTGKAAPFQLKSFVNAIWLTLITMTTVGYGDQSPRTFIGRLIDVVLVIWGTFIVSIMVVALTNTLNMDQSQKRALIVLNRLQLKKILKQSAALLITHSCRRYLINKKIKQKLQPPTKVSETLKKNDTFYRYLANFQNVQRQLRSMYEIDDIYEEMSRQFESINDEINILMISHQSAIDTVKKIINDKIKQITVNLENKNNKQNSKINNKGSVNFRQKKYESNKARFAENQFDSFDI